MEFLQKLMVIPQNIINALKNMKSQTNKVENIFVEPLTFCYESKVETVQVKQFDHLVKRKKLTMNQETQTEPQTKTEQIQIIDQLHEVDSQKNRKLRLVPSKQNKKQSKLLTKQIVQEESLSRASEQTEPSQYSYCQNHFLTILEQNEEQYQLEQKKIYQFNRKNQKQYRNQILKNYINKFKDKYIDEKQILKSTRTQSSDDKQISIDQKELNNNQQQQTLVQ